MKNNKPHLTIPKDNWETKWTCFPFVPEIFREISQKISPCNDSKWNLDHHPPQLLKTAVYNPLT